MRRLIMGDTDTKATAPVAKMLAAKKNQDREAEIVGVIAGTIQAVLLALGQGIVVLQKESYDGEIKLAEVLGADAYCALKESQASVGLETAKILLHEVEEWRRAVPMLMQQSIAQRAERTMLEQAQARETADDLVCKYSGKGISKVECGSVTVEFMEGSSDIVEKTTRVEEEADLLKAKNRLAHQKKIANDIESGKDPGYIG
jgi:hypothetical protein